MQRPTCDVVFCVSQVLQEEMGVVKSYNLKPGGDKIPVTKQNRKGESVNRVTLAHREHFVAA